MLYAALGGLYAVSFMAVLGVLNIRAIRESRRNRGK